MLKLTGERKTSVCVSEMKDGDVAVIVDWTCRSYIGRVVQRYGDYLITIGGRCSQGWGEYFKSENIGGSCEVRILEKDETLVVE